jgi:hypothetical protein
MAVWIEGTLRHSAAAQPGAPVPVMFKISEVVWVRAHREAGETIDNGCDVGLSDQSYVALNDKYADIVARITGTTGP